MKILYDYVPSGTNDSSVVFSASTTMENFPVEHLKEIDPVKSWKSDTITASATVKMIFSAAVTFNAMFLNRVNFAKCNVYTSSDDSTYTKVEEITDMAKDEIEEENYIHRWVELSGSYKYIKIEIPKQTPLFETSYFKIGNIMVGDSEDVWNPRPDFQVTYNPKVSIQEFKSGYVTVEKLGRTSRSFNGVLDRVKKEELSKYRITLSPFVVYFDFTSDPSQCFLVQPGRNNVVKTYQTANYQTLPFFIEEIV